MDSFDHYADVGLKYSDYSNATISLTAGRYGTAGVDMDVPGGSFLRVDLDNQNGYAVGLAYYRNAVASGEDLIALYGDSSGSSRQVGLTVNPSGTLSVTSSGSIILTTSKVIAPNSWYYVEFLASIGLSNSVYVYVNGNGWGSASGAVTQTLGYNTASSIYLGGAGRPYLDDVYINDTSGSINNSVWGDTRIEAVMPDGDGFWQQWDLSTGSQGWALLDNNPYNAGQYLSSGSLGDKFTVLMADPVASTGDMKSVQFSYLASKNDITTRETRHFIRLPSSSEYPDVTNTMTDSPVYYRTIWQNRPDNVAWNVTTLSESQFGVEVIS